MENIERVKRIAAIHDISGFGKCSLTVALPVVSATGVECSCIPTALLSTHTGEFTGWTRRDLTDQMLPIARHWHQLGIRFDGVYSGYLASPAQERVLEEVYGLIAGEGTLIVCDPAMADNGSYYTGFGHDMRDTFRRLCAHSHVITPNITEAALLAGEEYRPAPHSRADGRRVQPTARAGHGTARNTWSASSRAWPRWGRASSPSPACTTAPAGSAPSCWNGRRAGATRP